MEGTATEVDINRAGKESAEIMHAEHLVGSAEKGDRPVLTQAEIRKFMIQLECRVLPMLGIIYAVSIIDRINVSTPNIGRHWINI